MPGFGSMPLAASGCAAAMMKRLKKAQGAHESSSIVNGCNVGRKQAEKLRSRAKSFQVEKLPTSKWKRSTIHNTAKGCNRKKLTTVNGWLSVFTG